MIAVLQRVSWATLTINDLQKAKIDCGLVVLLGVSSDDKEEDVLWLSQKVVQMRIFADNEHHMNLSVKDVKGEILIVSQFTLLANTKKGNRPSFINAAHPDKALPLYHRFVNMTKQLLPEGVQTGEFGADMQVALENDGPVTIVIDSKNRV